MAVPRRVNHLRRGPQQWLAGGVPGATRLGAALGTRRRRLAVLAVVVQLVLVTAFVQAAIHRSSPSSNPVVLDRIQKGITTLANGSSSVTLTIDSVDLTRSFLTFSLRANNGDPGNMSVTGTLTNTTTVVFERPGTVGDVVIDWSVTSFTSGVTVQRGTTTLPGNVNVVNVPITTVDTGRSFPLISHRLAGTNFGSDDYVRPTLAASQLQLHTANTSASWNVVSWQVVSYNDATVQAGTVSFASGDSSRTATVSAVDTSKSWLIHTSTSADGTIANIGQKLMRGQVTNSTTLTFDRNNTGQTMDTSWFLVTFSDATTVQRGSAAFGTGTTSVQTAITAVDPARSLSTAGEMGYGGRSSYSADDNPGVGWATVRLITGSTVRLERAVTGSATADIAWQVIHWPGAATTNTVTVNSTADTADAWPGDGYCDTGQRNTANRVQCTLRAAIAEANASANINTIHFNIPATEAGYAAGPPSRWIIQPSGSGYGTITAGATLDATTQPGWTGNPIIQFDGDLLGGSTDGLVVDADSVTVRGLSITNWPDRGAETSRNGVTFAANWFGLTPAGGLAANGGADLAVLGAASGVTVGGSSPADANRFAAAGSTDGLLILGTASGTTVRGNTFGLAGDGVTPTGASFSGIYNAEGATGTVIAGNRLAHFANQSAIDQFSTGTLVVTGNILGLNEVGGAAPVHTGLWVGNTGPVRFGGAGPSDGNVVRNVSVDDGVMIADNSAQATVLGNSITGSAGLGIDIGNDGVTANDAGDGDTGPNGRLNFPVLSNAVEVAGTVTVDYTLDVPAGTYRVEFFNNPSGPDPSGHGEGEQFVHAATINHAGAGAQAFQATFAGSAPLVIAATATRDLGGGSYGPTSEFSAVRIVPSPIVTVNSTGDAADVSIGNGLCATGGTNSAGAPACTLRAAIAEANASATVNTIHFNIPATEAGHSAGVWTITPGSSLPALSTAMTLDATTQPGWATTPLVRVNGTAAGANLFSVTGPDVTIAGLNMTGASGSAVSITGDRAAIAYNHIGTNAAGTAASANSRGVVINGFYAVVDSNVISGITDNAITVDPFGHWARIVGNHIGVDVTGNAAIPNGQEGIEINGAHFGIVGEPGNGNIIGGGPFAAINAWTGSPVGWVVQANLIGVGEDGVTPLPNSTSNSEGGIAIRTSAADWLIGGTGPGEGNVIANNNNNGVQIEAVNGTADDIAILGNSIVAHSGLGIDIDRDGVTANDVGDGDAGPNGRLNFPVITGISRSAGVLTINYNLDVPAGTYRVEFFDNDAVDASGHGEGQRYLDADVVTHPGGSAGYTHSFGSSGAGFVAATTTEDLGGNTYGSTSEFSAALMVPVDSDGDGLWDHEEDADTDSDANPATNPGPDTDGDTIPNYLDPDDDGDGIPTAAENADPNGDGDPRDAIDTDRDGQPDYLDRRTFGSTGVIEFEQKISNLEGDFTGTLLAADYFSEGLSSIGDLDNDGVIDLAVGAPTDADGGGDAGAVYILFMDADGTVKSHTKISATTGGLTGPVTAADWFGWSVAGLGDHDGDGIEDIAVSARFDDDGAADVGAVYILFLNTNGTVKAEQKISRTEGGFTGTLDAADRFGSGVSNIGDINGDGTNDLAVGAHADDDNGGDAGAVYILFLNTDGTVQSHQKIAEGVGGFTGDLAAVDAFGWDVSGVGDLDGDGINDIVVGAVYDDDGGGNHGAAYVIFLNANGTVKAHQKISDTEGSFTAAFNASDWFGYSVAGLGDVDGDGIADIGVGAALDDDGGGDYGAAYILYMNTDGTVDGYQKISATSGDFTGPLGVADRFGGSITGLGDLDGNGAVDIAIGAWADDDGTGDAGAVYILRYVGPCPGIISIDADSDGVHDCHEDANVDADDDPSTNPGPDTDGDTIPNYLDPDDDGDGIPTAAENADPNGDGDPRDAIDTDRDGQPDWLDQPVSATGAKVATEQKISDTVGGLAAVLDDFEEFGVDATAIGDIDGDGTVDLAVGAPLDDDGGTDRGAVHILFLNPNGTVKNEQKISDTVGGLTATLDDSDQFAWAVAAIGDLDGDGTPDLAVSSYWDDDGGTNRGAVHILFLNPNGTVKAEQKISDIVGGLAAVLDTSDEFAFDVAGIGDLDGDGTPDLAIGTRFDDDGGTDRGAVYILFLNPNGTVKAEQKISDTTGGLTTTLDDGDRWGAAVDGIGDLDGDGVPDLVVGAPSDDDGGTDRGAIYLLFLNPNGTVKNEQKISDTVGGLNAVLDDTDEFGGAVAGLGDVNGDGAPDLAVGVANDDDGGANRGAAYVLFLNPNGTVQAEQKISDTAGGLTATIDDSDRFGFGLGALGDLDRDGTVGLVIGSYRDDDGGTNRGAVYVLDLVPDPCLVDSDADGLWDCHEDADTDGDRDPATSPGPDTDGDTVPNYLDPDDDGDGIPTASEQADPNSDGDPRDALDADRDGQPDWLDPPTIPAGGTVVDEQKISDTVGGLTAVLDDGDRFGFAVTSIGDLDGDGIVDLAVGAANDDDGGTDRGAVHLLFMNPNGTVRAEQKISDTAGGLAATLDNSDYFGWSVAGIGDLDGDGTPDLAVGAANDDDGSTDRGAVYLLFMNANGTVRAEQKISDTTGGLAATLDNGDLFARSVAAIGDLDGDGTPDLAVSAHQDDDGGADRGAVYLLFMNPNGTVRAEQKISDTAGGLATLLDNNDNLGHGLTGIGDLDRDGAPDLAVGAWLDDDGGADRGAVYLLFMNPNGTVRAKQKISDLDGDVTATLDDDDNFGHGLTGIGDLDGDGTIGLAIGALGDDDGGTNRGAVYVLDLLPVSEAVVNATGDSPDETPGDGRCDTGATNAAGAPECTLRAAIAEANASANIDTITFDIPTADPNHSAGTWTITPATLLPGISAPVTIDATTQPGTVVNTAQAPDPVNGRLAIELSGAADSVTVDWDGLRLEAGSSGSGIRGLAFTGWDNPASDAILIWGSSNNVIAGNFIGVDADGASAADGVTAGVGLGNSAIGNRIGGTAAADRNLIANDIPTDGGWTGVWAVGATTTGTVVQGNEFGLLIGGASAPGGWVGIHLWDGATASIGGTQAGAGNRITGRGNGVIVDDSSAAARASIVGNRIWGNSVIAVDLGGDGVTANDAGDSDNGPNDLLNYPVITSASEGAGSVSVEYTLDAPAGDYRIEFFDNDTASVSGHGEAQTPLAPDLITHPGGTVSYSHTVAGAAGDILTATTTQDLGGGTFGVTSELSAARLVNPGSLDPVVLDRIHKGVTTLADGTSSVSVTIEAVDPARSILTFSLRGNDANPDNLAVTGALANATTVTFERAGTTGNVVLDWSVTSFTSGVTVQRGTSTLSELTTDVAITPVDTSRSFALVSHRDPGANFGSSDFVAAALTTSYLHLTVDSSSVDQVQWQVVTYNDATVQSGSTYLAPASAAATATVAAVDTAKTWLIHSSYTAPGTANDIGQKMVRGRVTDSTTITFDRSNTGQAVETSWFLVSFTDATTVQRGSASFISGTTAVQTSVTAVDPARAIVVGGEQGYGGRTAYSADDNPGTGWFTLRLNGPSSLRMERAVTGSAAADLAWQVIHWPGPATGATATVNATGDAADLWPGDGYCDTGQSTSANEVQCTLRAAIAETNGNANLDTIAFDIPATEPGHAAGVWTIAPTSALPDLTTAMTVDGATQPGWTTTPVIELDGTGAGAGTSGLRIAGDDITVNALAVNRFAADGISVIPFAERAVITASHLGTDPAGTLDWGNGEQGIDLQALSGPTTVGGTTAGSGNLISGNGLQGIMIYYSDANTILGNRIGTDVTGNAALGNSDDGIAIGDQSNNNRIGQPGAGNVISGNTGAVSDGIELDFAVTGTIIEANTIGLGADGTTTLANGRHGIALYDGVSGTSIGGDGPGEGNVISGNTVDGVNANGNADPAASGTVIAGNRIGTDSTGTAARPNGGHGVHVFNGAVAVIGGVGAGNTIAHNTGAGVVVTASADDVAVVANSIHSNGSLGIDLGGDGVTLNDAGDTDTGPNGLLNHPVLTSAEADGGLTTVTYTLDAPAGDYRVELYANPSGADPSGFGEAETLLAAHTFAHAGGAVGYTRTVVAAAGTVLTATATEVLTPSGFAATSELSAARTVTAFAGEVALDASQRRSDARALGGLSVATPGSGIAGSGIDLAGGAHRLAAPATDVTSSELTVSAWVNRSAGPTDPRLVAKTSSGGTAVYELFVDSGSGELVGRLQVGGAPVEVRGGAIAVGQWHYAALTWDGTTVALYVDGVAVDTAAASGALTTDLAAPLVIGNRAGVDRGLAGSLDQVQVAHTARPAAWLATTEANLRQPGAFVTLGAVQTQTPAAWTTSTAQARTGSASLAAPVTPGSGAEAWAVAAGLDEPGLELEAWWRVSDLAALEAAAGTRTAGAPVTQYETALTSAGFDLGTRIGANRTQVASPAAGVTAGTWWRVVLRTDEAGTSTVLVNGVPVRGPAAHTGGPASGSVGFRVGALAPGESWHIDDVQIRRYVSDEPTTSLGSLDRN